VDDVNAEIPLPWERLLWTGRGIPFASPWSPSYTLTDFRLVVRDRVRGSGGRVDEIVLHDIADVHLSQSRLQRLVGVATLRVESRRRRRPHLILRGVRRGPQLAALLELLAGVPQTNLDMNAVSAALAWNPRTPTRAVGELVAALAVIVVAVVAVAGSARQPAVAAAVYAADDPIHPNGEKRSEEEIARFMEVDVMPWARAVLGPLKGGPDRVNCLTCHGQHAAEQHFAMPAVSALPKPDFKQEGWELYSDGMDAQLRNAIYGYVAEPQKQHRMGFMREVVMPGMARLLHRPAYDFTKTYAYNRSHQAFGCYHCHRVR
jgi:hypothetical protein